MSRIPSWHQLQSPLHRTSPVQNPITLRQEGDVSGRINASVVLTSSAVPRVIPQPVFEKCIYEGLN